MARLGRRGSCDAATAPSRGRATRWTVAVLVLMAALFAAPQGALAWKPFTHNFIGDQVYPQASHGFATVGHSRYPLATDLTTALRDHRASYNAGVVGPDGFPDIAYGQSLIHPTHTGQWLAFLLRKARAAQHSTAYTTREKAQILAFSYGFLTHAAGDMWGHTFINDFAQGLFPSVGEFGESAKAKIALRHIVAESYVGSATPGWDRLSGQRNRRQICKSYTPRKTGCDVSDDTTHPVSFNAPTKFIYDTFVNPYTALPVGTCDDKVDDDHDGTINDGCPKGPYTRHGKPEPQRGPLLDYFLDLEAKLQLDLATRRYGMEHQRCVSIDPDCHSVKTSIDVFTVRGKKSVRVTSRTCLGALIGCLPETHFIDEYVKVPYLKAWIDDIKDGLEDWGVFSLQMTKALFDPQARRDAQNAACHSRGNESVDARGRDTSPLARRNCEQGIGALQTINYKTAKYVNTHLLSMLGAPDDVGTARKYLTKLSSWLDDLLGPALNPLREVALAIEDAIATVVKDKIREATGLDYDQLRNFLTRPERWMCGANTTSITLGDRKITPSDLFTADDHRRIDGFMGLVTAHHQPSSGPPDCQPLQAGAIFPINSFAAMKSSIAQANMLLLDGTQLNLALGDVLTQAGIIQNRTLVHTYPANGNVMTTSLGPASKPWLDLIDGDHAWRSDGLPRFCSAFCLQLPGLTTYPRQPITQTGAAVSAGGTGAYPVWESCVLRPAFRAIFSDWENDANTQRNFPDLGDATSPDPATDPNPPAITVTPTGATSTVGGLRTVLPGGRFQPIGHDAVFNESQVKLSYRIYASGKTPGSFQPVENRGSFALPSGALIGTWVVEVRAQDPCGSSSKAETFSVV
ncbi:MAG: hypothetical protein QOI73_1809 [Solirubrobacteraceae bacterium]|nr:hypothetical protein [Solirubrobacteraceae bacterium]